MKTVSSLRAGQVVLGHLCAFNVWHRQPPDRVRSSPCSLEKGDRYTTEDLDCHRSWLLPGLDRGM